MLLVSDSEAMGINLNQYIPKFSVPRNKYVEDVLSSVMKEISVVHKALENNSEFAKILKNKLLITLGIAYKNLEEACDGYSIAFLIAKFRNYGSTKSIQAGTHSQQQILPSATRDSSFIERNSAINDPLFAIVIQSNKRFKR